MLKVVKTVGRCDECPHRVYASAGRYDCEKAGRVPLTGQTIPEWCPLPNDPAGVAAHALRMLDSAREVLLAASGELETANPERLRELIRIASAQIN